MEQFTLQLSHLKAYRKEREDFAKIVLTQPEFFKQLLDICFKIDDPISYKAAWVLEMVCLENIKPLLSHLESFLNKVPKVYKHQAVRPMAKICEELVLGFYSNKNSNSISLSTKQREQLTEICFDWLISEQKVAAKAYAMQCLFYLGNDFKWIHPELKIILNKNFEHQQPAFKARARQILKKISSC